MSERRILEAVIRQKDEIIENLIKEKNALNEYCERLKKELARVNAPKKFEVKSE